jgi:AraC-like DNA-binding protein
MSKYFKHKISRAINVSKIVTVHYLELNKKFTYPPESHDFWELHYVDKGHLFCYQNNEKKEVRQGELVFFKPMVEHHLEMDEVESNLCVISFECKSELLNEISDGVYKLTTHEKGLVSTVFEEAGKTFEMPKLDPGLKKMPLKADAPLGSMQLIELALEELVIRLLRKGSAKNTDKENLVVNYDDKIINQIIEYLSNNLSEKLSLSSIAKKMGYGKTFLCTRFKEVTGKTIFRFFTELQIEEAKKMIRKGKENTVSVISDALNFNEPSYFCAVFKKITGMSPKEYSRTIHAFDKE